MKILRSDYERYFALLLLRDRAKFRLASQVQLGIHTGLGKLVGKQIKKDWFLAQYDDPDRAEFEYQRHKASEV